jgi:hypothetical protein
VIYIVIACYIFPAVTLEEHRIYQYYYYCLSYLNGRWMEVSQIRPQAHLSTTCNGLILLHHLTEHSFPGLHQVKYQTTTKKHYRSSV